MLTDEIESTSSAPLVSVSITSYNAERWLSRAIDSVLAQRTSFPLEIVISDDCSKDGTRNIAASYQERFPNKIRFIARQKNLGMQRNTFETFEACRGEFIAWLDADDYWTDPDKLTLQVDALQSDPSINVCGHFVRWVTADGEVKRDRYPSAAAGRYGLADILHRNFLPAPSVMFRNGIHRDLPPWYFTIEALSDWPLHILSALSGDILLLDRVMADYMLTPDSAFMSKGSLYWYQADAKFFHLVESMLPQRFKRIARSEKGRRYESAAYLLRKQGGFEASRRAAWSAFRAPRLQDNLGSKTKALAASVIREAQWRLRGSPKPNPQ